MNKATYLAKDFNRKNIQEQKMKPEKYSLRENKSTLHHF